MSEQKGRTRRPVAPELTLEDWADIRRQYVETQALVGDTLGRPILAKAIAASLAFFKVADNHPECHLSAGWSRPAMRDDTKKLVDATLDLMDAADAVEGLDDACSDLQWKTREDVKEFIAKAKEWVRSWGWDWAFRPDRRAAVQTIRDRFIEEVGRPFMRAARKLLRSDDAKTRDEVEGLACEAIAAGYEAMDGTFEEARLLYDELQKPSGKGPIYGLERIEYQPDILHELGQLNHKLTRQVERDGAARDLKAKTATAKAKAGLLEDLGREQGPPREKTNQTRLVAHLDSDPPFLTLDGTPLPTFHPTATHYIAKLVEIDGARKSFDEFKRENPEFEGAVITRLWKDVPKNILKYVNYGTRGKPARLKVEDLQ